jgi:hypothetical protein
MKFPFTPKTGAVHFFLVVLDPTAFASWLYKNDPALICFFSEYISRWWAQNHGANLEIIGADVILLQRGP